MKDFFWQSILGLILLLAVTTIAVNPGGLALETGNFLEKAVSLSGAGKLLKGEKKDAKSGKADQPIIVLDPGHGGTFYRRKKWFCFS